MKTTTRQLTLCAMLTALALALSWAERFLPLSLLIPLPGIKLGLANIVTLFALYALGPAQALGILLCRCTLGAFFAGNLNALIYSLFGGLTAMLTMILLRRGKHLSVYGVSLGGRRRPQLRPGSRRRLDPGYLLSPGVPPGAAGSVPPLRGAHGLPLRPAVPGHVPC